MMSLLPVIGFLLLLFLAIYLGCIILKQYTYWKKRGLPHLKLVPLIGNNAPIFFRTKSPAEHSLNLYKQHPKARYYGFFDFRKPAIIIKDPELIRDVCIKYFDNFTDHEPFITEEIDPIAGRNLFSLSGHRWRDFRNTLSPSYTASRMKLLFGLMVECSSEFVRYFVQHPEEAKNFRVKETFTRYATDVIATSAFGVKVNSIKDRDNEFYTNARTAIQEIGKPLWVLKIVFMMNFSKLMRTFGATFFPKSTDKFFKKLIKETIELRKKNNVVRPDMLQLLINAMTNNEKEKNVSLDDIVGQAFIFFLAGFETSSSFMSFLILELAAHPEVQEKLYQEISEKFNDESVEIRYENLTELKYLDMVMNETLRLHPPAGLTNRRCTKSIYLPKPMMQDDSNFCERCLVEEGTIVIIPIFGLHRDPLYYPDPEKFDPERFNDDNKGDIKPYTFLPFGQGPRQCIGNRFALMESKIILIHMIQRFVFKFSKETTYPIEYSKKSFSLTPKNEIILSLEERKKNN